MYNRPSLSIDYSLVPLVLGFFEFVRGGKSLGVG